MSVMAYKPCVQDGNQSRWEEWKDPPLVVAHGEDDVLELPAASPPRAYVNGYPVVSGTQALQTGDLVRVMSTNGPNVFFRYAGRSRGVSEDGRGRRCAFTGRPIRGAAVRCACGRIMAEAVAEQIGVCACGATLKGGHGEAPPEELM